MSLISSTIRGGFALLGLFCTCAGVLAQPAAPVERVLKKDGKTLVEQAGKTGELLENITLPGEIKVTTNGTFRVQGGKERVLLDGQVLDKNGTLTSSDGTVMPVADHVAMKNGRVVVIKDGEAAPLKADATLANGTKVSPDGTIVSPDGVRTRLLDGQLQKLDGSSLPTLDTITMQGGKILVQKDGSLLPLAAGRNMMMSDGTKVFSDGTIVKRDGSTSKLSEGQILTLEGVKRRTP